MAMEGDVMKMRPMSDGIVIPAGETVSLEPGGLHVMFMGLSSPFIEGETVTVTLTFEKAGSVDVELAVGGVSAAAAEAHHGHH
jgi:periplasmic copper chaperone A